jgi:hypothetical protein
MIKPHGVTEIVGTANGIQELKILDGKTIYVKRDEKGKIYQDGEIFIFMDANIYIFENQ